jgi:hypothetical protein
MWHDFLHPLWELGCACTAWFASQLPRSSNFGFPSADANLPQEVSPASPHQAPRTGWAGDTRLRQVGLNYFSCLSTCGWSIVVVAPPDQSGRLVLDIVVFLFWIRRLCVLPMFPLVLLVILVLLVLPVLLVLLVLLVVFCWGAPPPQTPRSARCISRRIRHFLYFCCVRRRIRQFLFRWCVRRRIRNFSTFAASGVMC